MASPKRHHYLPQFYLEYFSRDGLLWVYDRELKHYRQQLTKDIAVQGHYCSFEQDDGTRNTEIEKLLSMIEGATESIISKLDRGEAITPDERETLATFIYFLKVRVPEFEEEFNEFLSTAERKMAHITLGASEERTAALISRYEADTGKKAPIAAKDLFEFVASDEYDVIVHRNESLKKMLQLANKSVQLLLRMEWLFLRTPKDKAYVTTDNPFLLLPPVDWKPNPYGFGIATSGTRKLIPLSRNTALMIFDLRDRMRATTATGQQVRTMNLTLTKYSRRFVIARDEALLRSLVRTTKISELNPPKRLQED